MTEPNTAAPVTTATFFNHLASLPRRLNYYVSRDMPKQQRDFVRAAMTGDLWTVQKIVKNNPDAPCWKDGQGFTGLMFAAREGRADVVDFLLPLSDVGAKTIFGWDALRFSKGSPHGTSHPVITAKIQAKINSPGLGGSSSPECRPA